MAAATTLALMAAAASPLVPGAGSTSLGLVFWRWLVAAHAGWVLPVIAVAWLAGRRARWPAGPAAVRGAAAAALVLVALDPSMVASLAAPAGPGRTVWLARLGASLSLLALAAGTAGRTRTLASLSFAGACAFWGAHWPAAKTTTPGVAPHHARFTTPPLLVVGIDGADWRYIDPLAARGLLPNIDALRRRGAWGPLETFQPTESPVIWTTIATGQPPGRHGIHGFTVERLGGVAEPIPKLLAPRGSGLGPLLDLARRARVIDRHGVDSGLRRIPAFWNIATSEGSPVGLVNWWVTWPAEPIVGYVVSERLYYRPAGARNLTYPESLARELAGLVHREASVGIEDLRLFRDVDEAEWRRIVEGRAAPKSFEAQFRYFLATHRTDAATARHLVSRGRHELGGTIDLLVLLRLVDMTCHTSLHLSELVDDHLGADPAEVLRSSRVVTRAYQEVDAVLGQLVEAFGPSANVVLLSDHGFQREQPWPHRPPHHGHHLAPDGIVLGAGPSFTSTGRVDGIRVLDVLPLLAYLKDLPIAEELPGRLPAEMIRPGALRERAPRRVADYGSIRVPAASADATDDEELLSRLRALGYIQ